MSGLSAGAGRALFAGSSNDVDSNERQTGPPRQRPAEWNDSTGADPRVPNPGERTAATPGGPEGWGGPRPAGQAPFPDHSQPGQYPPEHAPFARPPYGGPAVPQHGQPAPDPRWSGGGNTGYPAPGQYPPPGQPPYQQRPPYQGQPYPQQQQGQPYSQPQGQPYPRQQGQPEYGPGNRPPGLGGFSAGPPVPPTVRQRKKGSVLPALIFGLLAVVLAGVAGYLYIQENEDTGPIAPTARPAENQFIQVQNALQDAGLTATTERQNATSPEAFPTREPGQAIKIDDHDAWIYIFPSAEAQLAATDALTAEDPRPLVTTASGTELTSGPPNLFSGSNVIILLSMDDSPDGDVTDKIQEAVESLP